MILDVRSLYLSISASLWNLFLYIQSAHCLQGSTLDLTSYHPGIDYCCCCKHYRIATLLLCFGIDYMERKKRNWTNTLLLNFVFFCKYSFKSNTYFFQIPFARYISRTKLNHVKRYCIEKVYRKKRVGGFHPRELTECAFDIITSTTFRYIGNL